jgi:tetratricopeptide (TPR) repeat protein
VAYLLPRCLQGRAELALAAGDAAAALACADELLALARRNGLREAEAGAQLWRGLALLGSDAHAAASAELQQGLGLAAQIGRVSLQRDLHHALARLHAARGATELAQEHAQQAGNISAAMLHSLHTSAPTATLG